MKNGEVVAAVWEAPQIPSADGQLVYYLYEGVSHATRAKYQYWAHAGFAGCLMNTRHRQRLGVVDNPLELVDWMFLETFPDAGLASASHALSGSVPA